MKTRKLFGIVALIAIMGALAFTACDTGSSPGRGGGGSKTPGTGSGTGGTGGGGGTALTSVTYVSEDATNIYQLTVTSKSASAQSIAFTSDTRQSVSQAVQSVSYTPKAGDTFVLVVIKINSPTDVTRYTGTVDTAGDIITLTTTTITITVTTSSSVITTIEIGSTKYEDLEAVTPSGANTTGTSGDYKYKINSDGLTATITKYTGSQSTVTIPSFLSINSKSRPVTNIGDEAFKDCTSLTGVTIPNSIINMGYAAFAGTNLSSVNIPASIYYVGYTSFNGLANLASITVDSANPAYTSDGGVLYDKAKEVLVVYPAKKTGTSFTVPNSVKNIDDWSFCITSLTSVTIPNGVTRIGTGAFQDCQNLTSVTIPDSVSNFEGIAFLRCTNLTSVTIGNITKIGDWAFNECSSLTSVTFAGSNISNANFGNNAFPEDNGYGGNSLKTAYASGKAGTYTRPASGSTWTKQ